MFAIESGDLRFTIYDLRFTFTSSHLHSTVPLTLRFDVDYVPWDAQAAEEFGHGEPAMLLRLLELAKTTGLKYQFFISNRSLRAFPSSADAILGEGHDLDWLCTNPEVAQTYEQCVNLFQLAGQKPMGFALREPWPARLDAEWIGSFRFVSAPPGNVPEGRRSFPCTTRSDRDALRAGAPIRLWIDEMKRAIRTADHSIVCMSPQVLAKYDPKLHYFSELPNLSQELGVPIRTFRDILKEG
ncbi:MAG: hypothetical protein QOJ65_1284 [Fimbriimonadaceae bacterium]|jgi:hypothetical protein|nr:hypothetical protein [Fimbriimonadaceae bacterium]